MSAHAAVEGFALGAGLIIAIGAQNAFVLRQGLVGRHVGPVVAFCALSDAGLILLGALGVGALVRSVDALLTVVFFAGAAFLAVYGLLALRRAAASGQALAAAAEADGRRGLGSTLGAIAALTFLNPHVYLDTVLLVGGVSGRYPIETRAWFVGGAMTASLVWFTALGYGARRLAPVFARPIAWRVLDLIIAAVMLALAFSLAWEGVLRL